LFPLQGIPKAIEMIARIDPMSYGIDGLRGSLIGISSFGVVNDLVILTLITAVILWIGTRLFDRIEA
jgi:ABC-2 type transport system permease protein